MNTDKKSIEELEELGFTFEAIPEKEKGIASFTVQGVQKKTNAANKKEYVYICLGGDGIADMKLTAQKLRALMNMFDNQEQRLKAKFFIENNAKIQKALPNEDKYKFPTV